MPINLSLDRPKPSFGIYVHWPFCESKCPYCDFNTYADTKQDQNEWQLAYLRQLDTYYNESTGQNCDTIFFGGGTPSLLHPKIVAAIIERIDNHWGLAKNTEITLEANPSSSEASRFAGYSQAGINRLSIGVQSLESSGLKSLGRLHSVDDARLAFEIASQNFNRVSVDLMFGRQHQSLATWKNEIKEAAQWGAEHLSLYQLTIEPNTAFGLRHNSGLLQGLPNDDLAADMHIVAEEICSQNGYHQYEVSNFAKKGGESRHNLLYWRCEDYIGIGPGAHGRITLDNQRIATETHLSPAKWLKSVSVSGSGENQRTPLSKDDETNEYLMMSIRLTEGTDLSRIQNLTSNYRVKQRLKLLQEDNLVEVKDGRLKATRSGILVLNSIISSLTV